MDPSSAKTDLRGSLWGSLLYSGHERVCFFKTWGKMLKYDIMWWEERRETACGFWILGTVGILRCLQAKKGLGRACQVRWELPAGEQICQIEKVETKSSTPWGKICTVVKKPAWLRKTPVGSAGGWEKNLLFLLVCGRKTLVKAVHLWKSLIGAARLRKNKLGQSETITYWVTG